MKKFNRKTEQLKARVQFVRGLVRKDADEVLTDAEADTMTDQTISDEIEMGRFAVIERPTEEPVKGEASAPEGQGSSDKVAAPKAKS